MLQELLSLAQGPYALPILAASLVTYVLVSIIITYRRLSHFPGPFLASFSPLFMLKVLFSGHHADGYSRLNQQYQSPLVRIGSTDLITDDPAIIRHMNGARSAWGRSNWYRAMTLDPRGGSLFDEPDTKTHDLFKARLSFGYSGRENPGLESDIDEVVGTLIQYIKSRYISDDERGVLKRMDLAKVTQFFTLDVITRIAYGKEFGWLKMDKDQFEWTSTVIKAVPANSLMAELPLLQKIFLSKWFLQWFGPKHSDANGMGRVMGMAREMVAKRFGEKAEDRKDMLGSFVRHGIEQQACEVEVLFQILAGSDTTAVAVRSTFFHLATSKKAYVRLLEEIDKAVKEGKISSPIRAEEAKHLEYLQACVYEGLRMQAPFSGLCMKSPPKGGDFINGIFIPEGTRVGHNFGGLIRRRDVFGDDADVFRPERWLNAEPAKRLEMQQTTEMVFGYGRWACLGKPVALMELSKVFFEFFRRFDLQLVEPKNPWHEFNVNMCFQSDLWVKITERFSEGEKV
ncbi:cytochrome P450 [Neurospora hispaniola]|uniref:Cytochrome P450 monooxygenase ABA1 n=1 Tax=Neurospora hispaniola TaxID=588809 RepID=A0AAJ0I1K9_9PEZI|nr:cytochrome P450 [Neurospora hispaniola]